MSIVIIILQIISTVVILIMLQKNSNNSNANDIGANIANLQSQLNQRDELVRQLISEKLYDTQKLLDSKLSSIAVQNKSTLEHTSVAVNEKLDGMQRAINTALETMRAENSRQLDNINRTVNERLEKSITKQLTTSQEQIFTNLQSMTEKISQLSSIGTDITKLNKTLSNVKRRGIFGETQLFSIVEDILTTEQYQKNFRTSTTSQEAVECAVKLPSNDENELYLPIDAKFPQDKYIALLDARESLDQNSIRTAEKELKDSLLSSAKEICKYLGHTISTTANTARTTDYGIMFLPTEGLYAEALSLDVVNTAQHDYKIYIVGPTNLSALLTVFKTAYQSLALQEKTKEVEAILSVTKDEFEKFSDALDKVKKNMDAVQSNLDKVIGTRTNTIRRALKNITATSDPNSVAVFKAFSQFDDSME